MAVFVSVSCLVISSLYLWHRIGNDWPGNRHPLWDLWVPQHRSSFTGRSMFREFLFTRPLHRAKKNIMKIVVIGGSGLIGSQVVSNLQQQGHEVVAASLSSGVNVLTGEGLPEAIAGADVVVDVSNSPSFEDKAVMNFFETAGRNLEKAEKEHGVKHHVALSVVGTERLQASGYFRAKLVQENMIKSSGIPYSIVRATQFFEFVEAIAGSGRTGEEIHMPTGGIQPIASADVAALVAAAALHTPTNAINDIAGPERFQLDDLIRRYLQYKGDVTRVVTDVNATYFGTPVDALSLVPHGDAQLGSIKLEEWMKRKLAAV